MATEDSLEKFAALSELAKNFVNVAETYGRIIISEVAMDPNDMVIKPRSDVGGQAGGRKYITQGILFKFALDTVGSLDSFTHLISASRPIISFLLGSTYLTSNWALSHLSLDPTK